MRTSPGHASELAITVSTAMAHRFLGTVWCAWVAWGLTPPSTGQMQPGPEVLTPSRNRRITPTLGPILVPGPRLRG